MYDKTKIPGYLIYEVTNGKPIYFKGYKEVLAGEKKFEWIKGYSTLHCWLKTNFSSMLVNSIDNTKFDVLSGEPGIKMEGDNWRVAQVAIFKRNKLVLNKKYAENAPEIVIEIDVHADTEDIGSDMKYIRDKVDEYLEKGVQKVIWIFTEAEIVVTCTEKGKWQVEGWEKDIETIRGATINIAQMLKQRRENPAQ
ncbi:MAG: Uma2 family endonuclease [Saprospiraceae bacterium]